MELSSGGQESTLAPTEQASSPPAEDGTPLWAAGAGNHRVAALPRRAEVAVVGGGITGACLLHWLRARDIDAVLLEARHLAAGASGRNAGFVLNGVAENYRAAVDAYTRAIAAEVWHFTAENHRILAGLLAGRAGYVRRGSWTIATSAGEATELEESAVLLAEDGVTVEWEPHGGNPALGHRGALLNPSDAELDPAAAVRALAAKWAGSIHEGCSVRGLHPGAGEVRLDTSGGELVAGAVVLATNAWSAELLPELPISPVRGQLLATAPDPVARVDRPTYAARGFQYWRQRSDGRLLVGGWRDTAIADEIGLVASPTEAVQRHLEAHLRALGSAATVSHRWAGIMGFTADHLPLVGPTPASPRILVCGGYSGHGLAFAPLATHRLAQHLLDGERLPSWMSPARAPLASPAAAG